MVTLLMSAWSRNDGVSKHEDEHCCKRDITWHSSCDQYKKRADEETTVKRDFPSDDIC